MHPDEIRLLFDYNAWANRCIREAASQASDTELSAPAGLSHGSLHDTLAHILVAEWVWRKRCQEGVSPRDLPAAQDFPDLANLQQRWQEEENAWSAYLAGLTEQDLSEMVRYSNTRGRPFETPLWQILMHLVNHGTQHRSEAAIWLTRLGHSPGDLDLIQFLRSKE